MEKAKGGYLFNFQKILREIQRSVFCPICKKKYNLKEIKIRGFFDKTLILEVKCNNHNKPLKALFVAQPKTHSTKKNKNSNPITSSEANQFRQNIRQFNENLQF
jgi:hypothetical protein